MSALHESLRKQLEKTVIQARDVAEEGARAALDRLAAGLTKPFDGLTEAERDLRTRLRARGRQLGDVRKASGEQEMRRLAGELAYEYWHRMLFARFLAENDLLMHPEAGVSVSLADCEELAREEGLANGWLLAERWAARMLPEIFRPADPLLQVPFAPEHERALEKLLEALPAETFRASDALGWVYQFWQARRKEEVNKSGVKIGAEELPAVTQLFTEPYMVHFLLDNTLGAWWTARHPGETPPVAFEYLRLLEDGTPAAGTFEGWPKRVAELKVLDPCCGSGHFLVAAFLKLVPLRMREEGLSAREACDAVLRDNLHGLEIDPRCTQIAAFAVALAAWTHPGTGGHRALPSLSIACVGLTIRAHRDEWLALAGSDKRAVDGLSQLYNNFRMAPLLGSLLVLDDPGQRDALIPSPRELRDLTDRALASEFAPAEQKDSVELGVVAAGLARAAGLLWQLYHLVATNVPYVARGKQSEALRRYSDDHLPASKHDLATMFLDRWLRGCAAGGSVALVAPQNWLFQPRYTGFRKQLLSEACVRLVARIGEGGFSSSQAAGAFVGLFVVSNEKPNDTTMIVGVDASDADAPTAKAASLMASPVAESLQADQRLNPDSRILLGDVSSGALLAEYADSRWGLRTADGARFIACFWELPEIGDNWCFEQGTVEATVDYGGREHIIFWEEGRGALRQYADLGLASLQGRECWGTRGVLVSLMRDLPVTLYTGEIFDNNSAVVWPRDPHDLGALWAYCSSEQFAVEVRRIDKALKVTNASLIKIPFDAAYWRAIAAERGPLPLPASNDPTQWLFDGCVRGAAAPLQVAVCNLLGYSWPEQQVDALEAYADRDGIVCLPAVSGERPAADRLRDVLAAAYGAEWNAAQQAALLAVAGSPGATLESWLRDDFFAQHCALFHQRPFIWHVWDGRKDGFAALVNYHKLDRHTLQTLAYTYLGDWITRQEADAKAGKPGADLRLASARALQRKLELILEGEPPYDIFVRWKPIERQPVGWEPDLNDGGRLNIRPFVVADVLRKKPNIKWGKDRGKNPPGAPWGEERFNSYEEYFPGEKLTNAMRLAARADAARTAGASA